MPRKLASRSGYRGGGVAVRPGAGAAAGPGADGAAAGARGPSKSEPVRPPLEHLAVQRHLAAHVVAVGI